MKAAIFDFNGTLFYDTDKHKQAWKAYGEELLGRPVTEEEWQISMLGRNNRLILTFLLGRTPTEEETTRMGGEKEACYRKICLNDPATFHLAPGAENFLDWLKEQGIPCTIATSSDMENLNFYFEHFGLSRWFSKELCVYEDGTFTGKPAPDIYVKAMEKLRVKKEDCVVFEDALSGIRAAYSAGSGSIVAIASSAAPEYLAKAEGVTLAVCDYTAESIKQLFE
ncbi:MAG: HAD family phosphatase [Clostridia bacterium]|nr:HAD family phosphatase [Clostridia bacterium]